MRDGSRGGRCAAAALAAAAVLGAAAAPARASFTQEPGSPIPVGTDPFGVVTGDFNGDQRPDAVAINGTSSTVSVLLRLPAGGFVQETGSPIAIGSGPNFGTVADFNRDGRPDIAVANYNNVGNVSVLLRQAGGSFAHVLYLAGPAFGPTDVAAADFDGVNGPDIAVTNGGGGTVTILKNSGTGTFAAEAPPTATGGTTPRYAAVGDFNGDHRPDLAVTNANSGSVSILLRKAGGGFAQAPGSPILVGTTPYGVVSGDFNGDGRPDVAVANYGSNSVSVLLGQSGGAFTQEPGSPLTVGANPVGLATGDFNRDGARDLAVANSGASSVTVLLRKPGGGFTPDGGSPVATAAAPYGVAVADFNADGRPDLTSANLGGDNLSILLNTTPPPPGQPVSLDADGDGVIRPFDCNDNDPKIHPGARDIPGDKIDQDCNGRDARFPLLDRRIESFQATYPQGYTMFTSLSILPVRRGDTVRLTCRGHGCQRKSKKLRVRKNARKLSLLRYIGRAKLRNGAVVELRVTRPATIGRVARWTIRAPKTPRIARSCLRPGAKRPGRCP